MECSISMPELSAEQRTKREKTVKSIIRASANELAILKGHPPMDTINWDGIDKLGGKLQSKLKELLTEVIQEPEILKYFEDNKDQVGKQLGEYFNTLETTGSRFSQDAVGKQFMRLFVAKALLKKGEIADCPNYTEHKDEIIGGINGVLNGVVNDYKMSRRPLGTGLLVESAMAQTLGSQSVDPNTVDHVLSFLFEASAQPVSVPRLEEKKENDPITTQFSKLVKEARQKTSKREQ